MSESTRLDLPTDEALDRALAQWKASAVPAGQGNGDGARRAPDIPAPEPRLDRRRLIQTASELLAAREPSTPSKQAAYRQRLAAAGRCTRCGDVVEPGQLVCQTHHRSEGRRSMLRRHQKTVDEIMSLLRSDPTLLGPEGAPEFKVGVFLLLMFRGLRPPTAALLADFSDADRDAMLGRLAANGIYRRSPQGHVTWHGDFLNKETGNMEFVLTVLVALGIVERLPAAPEPPVAPQKRQEANKNRFPAKPRPSAPSGSHHRRPAEECLVCRRLQGRCRRHGGPSRSTSFRGAAPRCAYCKRPKGHSPSCRRAR